MGGGVSYDLQSNSDPRARAGLGAGLFEAAKQVDLGPSIELASSAGVTRSSVSAILRPLGACHARFRLLLMALFQICLKHERFKGFVVNRLIFMMEHQWVSGAIFEAKKFNAIALDIDPHNRELFDALIFLHQEFNEPSGQMHLLFECWHENNPGDPVGYASLIESHMNLHNVAQAVELLRELREREPGSAMVAYLGAKIDHFENRLEEAAVGFRSAIEKAPFHVAAMTSLASLLESVNRRAEAIELLEKAVDVVPDHPAPYDHLAQLKYYKTAEHPHVIHMHEMVEEPSTRRRFRADLHFTLGTIYDYLGEYEEAFGHFRRGNDFKKKKDVKTHKLCALSDQVGEACRGAIQDINAGLDVECGKELVFIVGMPRCGSTLTEQILASHPAVCAGGERSDIRDLIVRLEQASGDEVGYPNCLRNLDACTIKRLSDAHLGDIRRRMGGKAIYVDKALNNYLHLEVLVAMFPGAKIIHCRRNPIDTCLSCYFQNFNDQIDFSTDLAMMASVYRSYERLMEHWKGVLRRKILDVQYEDLVRHPEAISRQILDHCGLPWDPACLEHYATHRAVFTASRYQVRLPIYKTSVERWRNYELFVPELLDCFGPSPPSSDCSHPTRPRADRVKDHAHP
jgi:tetratricopeptide (TPR) repeat protein